MRRKVVLPVVVASLLHASSAAWAAEEPILVCAPIVLTQAQLASCDRLLAELQSPAAFVENGQIRLDLYESLVTEWLSMHCYRSQGWTPDRNARDTGPYPARIAKGKLESVGSRSTHGVARIWYSAAMHEWMQTYRPGDESQAPGYPDYPVDSVEPIPNGAIMVKEMWKPPASRYPGENFDCKSPFDADGSGAVIFVRDNQSFSSGWFAGWYGRGFEPDWPQPPARPSNSFATMGQGGAQYCINCHASTAPGNTFASMKNVLEGGATFLTQLLPAAMPEDPHHVLVSLPPDRLERLGEPLYSYDPGFLATFPGITRAETWQSIQRAPWTMPSRTFDSVLVPGAPGPYESLDGPLGQFFTSSQCVGCHQANATGLSFDMLISNPFPDGPDGDQPVSVSPYSLWSSSPMGLGGRDPIFFSQLESEQVLHADPLQDPAVARATRLLIQDTCLTCHGNMAERQRAIDNAGGDDCAPTPRTAANAVPFAPGQDWNAENALDASYGALARDGISCATCHLYRSVASSPPYDGNAAGNRCIKQKQRQLNPTQTGLAATFTGTFLVGPREEILGPFEHPKEKPMQNSLGFTPIYSEDLAKSEMCASCHTIHLPVLDQTLPDKECTPDDPFACRPKRYEQTTYPEWAFSEFRTEEWGGVPAGSNPKSCQDCHMKHEDEHGSFKSKIASIEEYSNYPQTDYRLAASEIDLPVRDDFARHYLVGLNVFFVKLAQQFPDVLGIPTQDQGTGGSVAPLIVTEQAMLDQAADETATIEAAIVDWDGAGNLEAEVTVQNLVGHKFPSGVSFRRAFIEFSVLDGNGDVLWASGRTNDQGVLVDENDKHIRGEFWWRKDCSSRREDLKPHQPHYETITEQGQAQIYQELYMRNQEPVRLTTSFLSIGKHLKDNRLQPKGFLGVKDRYKIANALGDHTPPPPSPHDENHPELPPRPDESFAEAVGPQGRARHDPDYRNGSGQDTLRYTVTGLEGRPAAVRARLYYQATPPFFLQDRFCLSTRANPQGDSYGEAGLDWTTTSDTERLYFLTGHLNVDDTEIDSWKLEVADTGRVAVAASGG